MKKQEVQNNFFWNILFMVILQDMRAKALDAGFTLNEYSLRPMGSTLVPGEPLPISSEEDVFDYIGMKFKKPTERNMWTKSNVIWYSALKNRVVESEDFLRFRLQQFWKTDSDSQLQLQLKTCDSTDSVSTALLKNSSRSYVWNV